jgi:hypothetical protein
MEARIDGSRLLVTIGSYGGWSARAQTLIYRLEAGRFRLIGREVASSEHCQDSDGAEHVSENWLTRTKIVRRGAAGNGETSRYTGQRWLEGGPPAE